MIVFEKGGKTGEPEEIKKPWEQGWEQQQTQPTYDVSP